MIFYIKKVKKIFFIFFVVCITSHVLNAGPLTKITSSGFQYGNQSVEYTKKPSFFLKFLNFFYRKQNFSLYTEQKGEKHLAASAEKMHPSLALGLPKTFQNAKDIFKVTFQSSPGKKYFIYGSLKNELKIGEENADPKKNPLLIITKKNQENWIFTMPEGKEEIASFYQKGHIKNFSIDHKKSSLEIPSDIFLLITAILHRNASPASIKNITMGKCSMAGGFILTASAFFYRYFFSKKSQSATSPDSHDSLNHTTRDVLPKIEEELHQDDLLLHQDDLLTDLPKDMLLEIAKKLPQSDYTHLAETAKAIREFLKDQNTLDLLRKSKDELLSDINIISYKDFKKIHTTRISNAAAIQFSTLNELDEFLSSPDAWSFDKLRLEFKARDISDATWKKFSNFSKLKQLVLSGNDIRAKGAKAIATHLRNLTSLDLGDNDIGAEGAEAIATHLRNLTSLNLRANGIGDEGVKAIATDLRNLTSLDLGGNDIGDEGAKAIATHLRNLTSLNLRRNNIGDEGAKAIATHLRNLTSLNLRRNDIGDEGAEAIATHLPNLTSLDLGINYIGDEGAEAIATHLPNLTSLDLGINYIGAEGAKAIATHLRNLTSLNLRRNDIGDEGAEAIATHLRNLTSLDLEGNDIGDEGAKAIATDLRNLTSLDLEGNDIGDEGAEAIATHLRNLTSLNLRRNDIGDEGAEAIATHLPNLTSLDLGDNDIGAEGARAIATHLRNLTSLDLGYDNIGAEGAKAIATHLRNLTSLDLSSNNIGAEGARAIATHLPNLIKFYN